MQTSNKYELSQFCFFIFFICQRYDQMSHLFIPTVHDYLPKESCNISVETLTLLEILIQRLHSAEAVSPKISARSSLGLRATASQERPRDMLHKRHSKPCATVRDKSPVPLTVCIPISSPRFLFGRRKLRHHCEESTLRPRFQSRDKKLRGLIGATVV